MYDSILKELERLKIEAIKDPLRTLREWANS